MKKIFFSFTVITSFLFLTTCKKELSCEGCTANQPPVADAGTDQVSVLPKDSVLLNGSASHDPDGSIVKYQWTKLDGPSSVRLALPGSAKTLASLLAEGVYHFRLEVTDDKGAHAQDTMQVTVVKSTGINQPPVAKAGADTTLILPLNTVTLNGSSSYDPDGVITTYNWSKISGPSSFLIDSSGAAKTKVSNLVEGVYLFQLTVTDNNGLSAKDSIQVTINAAPVQLCDHSAWPVVNINVSPVGSLSEARVPGAGALLNKVVFAGGWKSGNSCCFSCGEYTVGSSAADIYDVASGSWQQHELSRARLMGAVASVGNKIIFAGGTSWIIQSTREYDESYDNVDIYDAYSNNWEVTHLSEKRENMAVATIGNKVFFAGGTFYLTNPTANKYWDVSNAVDIYDATTGQWSAHRLSIARFEMMSIVLNDKVYFIGGYSSYGSSIDVSQVVDVYNNTTGTWSVSDRASILALLAPPAGVGQIIFITQVGDNIIFWAADNKVGVRNLTSGKTSTACLSFGQSTYLVNNKIVFYDGYHQLVFYDPLTAVWSRGEPNIPAGVSYSAIMLNNSLYLAGGIASASVNTSACVFYDKVYKVTW